MRFNITNDIILIFIQPIELSMTLMFQSDYHNALYYCEFSNFASQQIYLYMYINCCSSNKIEYCVKFNKDARLYTA